MNPGGIKLPVGQARAYPAPAESNMAIVSVYNNKGGVGKSTLTVGLAEFLAGNRKRSVLVMDLDAQSSSSGALLGRAAVAHAIDTERTVAQLTDRILQFSKPPK